MDQHTIPSGPIRRRAVRSPLLYILLAAGLLRLIYHLQVRDDPTFTVPIWDAAAFDDMARRLAAGQGTGFPKAYFFGPLYPYFLGAVYAVSGARSEIAVLLQHAAGVLICFLTYQMGSHWFGRRAGLLAAALLALAGPQIFFEGTLLMEVLVSTLLAGQAALLVRLEPGVARWRFLAAGILLGLAAIGRPTLLLLMPLVSILLMTGRSRPLRSTAVATLIFVLGAAIFPTATMIRNFRVEQVLVPITSSGGFNFYLGNSGRAGGLFLDNRRVAADASWNGEDSAETAVGRQMDSAEISRYWFGRALDDIRSGPLSWAGRYLDKTQLFLNGQDVPQIESYTHARRRNAVLRLSPVGMHLLMTLAVAGMAVSLPRRKRLLLLYAITGTLVLATALFFITTRYRIVALPYLSLFAAGYVVILWDAGRGRRWKSVAAFFALGIAAFLFTAPARYPLNERNREYAQLLHDGFRYAKVGRHDEALAAYAEAGRVRPEDYESHLASGIVLQTMGDLVRSLDELERAMRLDPGDAEVPYHLGITLYKMNRFAAAEQALNRSLEINPRGALTHAYLGLALAADGRYDGSRQAFLTSLELDPFRAFTHGNYGALLAMQGDRESARRHLARALELDPGFVSARRNLVYVHLDDGDTTAAKAELGRILAVVPDDPEARQLLRSLE